MKIIIGPFFNRTSRTDAAKVTEIVPLDIVIEWSTTKEAHSIPLFRLESAQQLRLKHIIVRAGDLPRDVDCAETQVVETSVCTFVPLDALLAALYRSTEISRPIRDVLAEMAGLVPLGQANGTPATDEGFLLPAAEADGFRLIKAMRSKDEILLSIGWRTSNASLFHVLNCRFGLQQGELVGGAWVAPQGEVGVSSLLADDLRRLFPVEPAGLLTPAGLRYLASLQARG